MENIEEPKQENCCTPIGQIKRYLNCVGCDQKPKQETLEEAAERLAYDSTEENKGFPKIKAFKDGAEWQAERMYSKENILDAWELGAYSGLPLTREKKEKLFEQFKKK